MTPEDASKLAGMLLELSDEQLDPIAKDSIRTWMGAPTAEAVKRTLDLIVNGSLASAFEVRALDIVWRGLGGGI